MQYYYDELMNSSVCLSPEGWAPWSAKVSRILNSGCVPLFVADGIGLPYHNSIDWRSISFKLTKHRAMEINDIIKIVTNKELVSRKLRNVFESRHDFIYYLDGLSGAICHLLHELKLKSIHVRNNIAWDNVLD
jgi:xylogalacturonan beta-1,3-xylosyltransferase